MSNRNAEQFNFFNSAVTLQRLQGQTVISRKFLTNKWLSIDPQPDYGTGRPFEARATHVMRKIAELTGGAYIKDKRTGPNANARIVY
jgi:hypothetical protein